MTPLSQGLLTGFAANLRRLMDLRGMRSADLAEAAEIDPGRVADFLGAKEEAGAIEVMRLAGALRAEPGELFDGLVWVSDGEGGGTYQYDG